MGYPCNCACRSVDPFACTCPLQHVDSFGIVVVFATVVHGLTPKLGIWLMNASTRQLFSLRSCLIDVCQALSVFKIVILLFISFTGWAVLAGKTPVQDPHANFRDVFAGSSRSSNDVRLLSLSFKSCWPTADRLGLQYATAMFKVLHAYDGWSNVNYVLNNVKNPVRTLKVAGALGLSISTTLYFLGNVAYFA